MPQLAIAIYDDPDAYEAFTGVLEQGDFSPPAEDRVGRRRFETTDWLTELSRPRTADRTE